MIDTITSKVVLILGRFTEQRKPLLDRIRVELRNHDYLPVLFDFERPASKSFIETVGTLAQLSRFVIVDLTDARIVLDEVPYIARWTSVPIRPIIRVGQEEPVTLADLRKNHRSVLPTYVYEDSDSLFAVFQKEIIEPAEAKARELR